MAPQETHHLSMKRKRNPDSNTNAAFQRKETGTLPKKKKKKDTRQVNSNPAHDKQMDSSTVASKQPTAVNKQFHKSDTPSGGGKSAQKEGSRKSTSKELTETRKKKKKPNYALQHELALIWEKMRRRDISKEERSKLITDALKKMKGKVTEIAGSHVSSRVLQTCIKYCQPAEKSSICDELRPHFLTLSRNKYAVHLVNKMLDSASKSQLDAFVSSLSGHVSSLLRHQFGATVVEHAFRLANTAQKRALLLELFSTEFRLFKSLSSISDGRLADLISRHGLKKSSVLEHISSALQPILKKEIVDHSIVHTALMEFFSIADKSRAEDVIQQLCGSILVRMIHTKDGSKVGVLCIKHSTAKERKKVIKSMKGHVEKIALDQYGSMVLTSILCVVDDTKLIAKAIVPELQSGLKDLILDKNGRRPLLQLLSPYCSSYFSPDDLSVFNLSVPSLSAVEGEKFANTEMVEGREASKIDQSSDMVICNAEEVIENDDGAGSAVKEVHSLEEKGRKDPSLRRFEILMNSGLAKKLVNACIEHAEEFLKSNFAKDVIYEVAVGGSGGLLWEDLEDKLDELHLAISQLCAAAKVEKQDHVFENFHSSRIIRKLVLNCPRFAIALWNMALKDKCKDWAQGHSSKIVSAYAETADGEVKELVKFEVQTLIDSGVLKVLEARKTDVHG